jgi:RNA recognition motif-containing protein
MGKKLFIGNLPYSATDASLAEIFSQAGQVTSAKVVMDRMSGRSKGFGFVEMTSDADAAASVEKFHGADYDGRTITVAEAKPQPLRMGTRETF